MPFRVAPAAQSLLTQATIASPHRSTASDGTIGDAAHRARQSDHNPRPGDHLVMAADLTHDPRHLDAHSWIRWYINASKLPGVARIKYAISNHEIWEPGIGWHHYDGESPHTEHVHISIKNGYERNVSTWGFEVFFYLKALAKQPLIPGTEVHNDALATLRIAIDKAKTNIVGFAPNEVSQGSAVACMQILLNAKMSPPMPPLAITGDLNDPRTQQALIYFKTVWHLSNPSVPACAADTWFFLDT